MYDKHGWALYDRTTPWDQNHTVWSPAAQQHTSSSTLSTVTLWQHKMYVCMESLFLSQAQQNLQECTGPCSPPVIPTQCLTVHINCVYRSVCYTASFNLCRVTNETLEYKMVPYVSWYRERRRLHFSQLLLEIPNSLSGLCGNYPPQLMDWLTVVLSSCGAQENTVNMLINIFLWKIWYLNGVLQVSGIIL